MKQILADRPDWIDDPDFKGTVGPYNPRKKVYRPKTKKKDPKKTKKTKKDHAFGLDPSKDKVTKKRPRRITGKRPTHGKGTYGADVPSDTKYGKRKPVTGLLPAIESKMKIPPRKPPVPKPTSKIPTRRLDVELSPIDVGVGHSGNVKPVRTTAADHEARAAAAAARQAEIRGRAAAGRARAIANLKSTDWGGIEAGSDVTPVRTRPRSGKPSRHGPGTYGAVIPPRRGTPAKPPTKISDPIDPAIEAKRKSVLAERARAAAAKAPPKQRWPGATTKRVSTRDKGVIETGLNLEPEGIKRTPKKKHQDTQALKRLVAKYGGKISDWWNASLNRPLSDAEAKAKAGLDATKQRVRSGKGFSAVENYKGGQPKKKKKKSTSRRVKNKHKGYDTTTGAEYVAKYYTQENNMGPHTLLKNPPDLEKINGKPTGQGYGAAHEGPEVKGTPHEEVVNANYESGETFKLDHNSVKNIHVR